MRLSAAVSTADRAKNQTDWKKEPNYPALLNYISKISQMSSVTITSYLVYRLVLYMSTNTYQVLPWHVLVSQRNWQRSPEKKTLLQSATVLPEKEMTRSVSSLVSKHLLRISKSLLLGVMTSGRWIPVRQRSHTAKHTESIFHSAQTKVTAVTVTYGISAMKDLSWRILQTSQIMIIFWFLVFPLRKLRTKANM